MRDITISQSEQTPRPVVALATDYAPGLHLAPHRHRRSQFLYSISGLMEVNTGDGQWMVLPGCGVWIPAEILHSVRMLGASTRSLYIQPEHAPRASSQCEVLSVSPLLHQLLLASAEITLLYDLEGRDGLLLRLALAELAAAQCNPLFTPLPADPALATLCREFLQQPDIHQRPQQWADKLHKSQRTFSRFFRQQTGMAFSLWRQRACLNYSLLALSRGESVTHLALTLGYQNSSAFSAMFRQATGYPPGSLHTGSPITEPHP